MATTEPQKWSATLGASADVNTLPETTPSGSGRASTSGLFPPVTQLPLDQGGIAPERGDFNALFKYLGEYLFYLMQGGTFSYSTDYDYTAGNLVMHGGSLYLCIASNGPGSAIKYPTDTAYWRRLATLQDIPPAATVNDGQLTINVNGSAVATFTANQAGDSTADITVPAAPTVGDGTITVNVAGTSAGSFTTNQGSNSTINIPAASASAFGVVKIGSGITVTDGVIFHNTLASSDYGYLKHGTFDPRPNYFAVLLWNRLMGKVCYALPEQNSEGAHIYCHSRKDGKDEYVIKSKDDSFYSDIINDLIK